MAMIRLSVLALLVPALAVAAPVPKGERKELYFPTTVGAKKVIQMKAGDDTRELTETVTKVEEKDGVYTVTVERDFAGGGLSGQPLIEQVFEVSAKGVYRLSSGGTKTKTPYPLLNLGVKAGEKWTSELELTGPPGGGGPVRVSKGTHTMGKEEEVEVPAGKFKAVRVDVESDQNGQTAKSTAWHAAGVGLVKYEVERGGIKNTQELKSFTPGKGEKKDEPKKDK
jgi:hypothetical protein